MTSDDKSISAAILTAAYLDKSTADIERYMSVYSDFLSRIGGMNTEAQSRSDERERRKPNNSYEYKRTS